MKSYIKNVLMNHFIHFYNLKIILLLSDKFKDKIINFIIQKFLKVILKI